MANLSITNVCNQKCSYCFARDTQIEYGKSEMNDAIYNKTLDYLDRSGMKEVRLLGGEPTLHPRFTHFVEEALKRDFEIMLFTNGLLTNKKLQFLKKIPKNKLRILLNTIPPGADKTFALRIQQKTMHELHYAIIPGVNIYSTSQSLDYLIDCILSFNLKKEIRLGLAHPVLSKNNAYLHPNKYSTIGKKIAELKKSAVKHQISLGFDCGFVPCMFSLDDHKMLKKELEKAGNCCHPIIDLLSDGSFISCYPLNNFIKFPINEEITAKDLIRDFHDHLVPYTDVGIYPYCSVCPLFKKKCNGGCAAFRIKRYITF